MKTTDLKYVDMALNPLIGLADDDETVLQYQHLDSNNEDEIKQVIRHTLKPYFAQLDAVSRERVKDALRYCLFDQNTEFERVFYSNLMPFDAPPEPRQFFVWLWEELFSPEDYHVINLSEYEPRRKKRRRNERPHSYSQRGVEQES